MQYFMGSEEEPTKYCNFWVRSFCFNQKCNILLGLKKSQLNIAIFELYLFKIQPKIEYLMESEEEPTKYINIWVST